MFRFSASLLPSNLGSLRRASLACLAAAVAVAGCGGGSKSSYFTPTQIIAYGDENSAFDTDGIAIGSTGTLVGLHYTLNVLSTSTKYCTDTSTTDPYTTCASTFSPNSSSSTFTGDGSPTFAMRSNQIVSDTESGTIESTSVTRVISRGYICSPSYSNYSGTWLQRLAYDLDSSLNFGSSYCPLDSGNAVTYASWGKKVDAVVTEVNDSITSGEIKSGVLVTIFVGQYDILEKYDAVIAGTKTKDAATTELATLGSSLATAIRAASNAGAKVLFVSVPNLKFSPKIQSANAASTENGTLLQTLTLAFNNAMKSDLYDVSGHKIGLVDAFNMYTKVDDSDAKTKVRTMEPACKTAVSGNTITTPDGQTKASGTIAQGGQLTEQEVLLFCTSETMVTNASISASRWADYTHFAPLSHYTLGTLAYNRVRDNF